MGGRGIGGLKMRVGRECSISRGWARLYSGGIHVGRVREGSQCYEWGHGRGSSSKSSEVVSTSEGPIWSRYSIALTCPVRSHFQRTLSKERWNQGWDERYRSSTE